MKSTLIYLFLSFIINLSFAGESLFVDTGDSSCHALLSIIQMPYLREVELQKKLEEMMPGTKRIYVNQNGGNSALGDEILYSEGFSTCDAWIIKNKSTGKLTLFHVDGRLSVRGENSGPLQNKTQREYFDEIAMEDGEKEAILIAHNEPAQEIIPELLRNNKIKVVMRIKAGQYYKGRWAVAVLNKGKNLLLRENSNERYLIIPAFSQ
jgi:hypothetical protein